MREVDNRDLTEVLKMREAELEVRALNPGIGAPPAPDVRRLYHEVQVLNNRLDRLERALERCPVGHSHSGGRFILGEHSIRRL